MEDLVDLGAGVLLADFGGGESQELGEVDASGLILIEFGEDLVNEFASAEAELDELLFQFLGVDNAAAVLVENLESSPDLDDLLAGESQGDVVVSHKWLGGSFSFWWLGRGTFGGSAGGSSWSSFLHKIF